MMAGATFSALEQVVISQNITRGTSFPNIRDAFADSWKLFAAVTILCGDGCELEHMRIVTETTQNTYRNGLEKCMGQLVHHAYKDTRRTSAFHHHTTKPGCGGSVRGQRCSAMSVDGMEV